MTPEQIRISNDQILSDYQQRYLAAYDRMVNAIDNKTKPSAADFKLMKELNYIMVEYKRDPFQHILVAKLQYNPGHYGDLNHVITYLAGKMQMLDWWYKWKPDALFL